MKRAYDVMSDWREDDALRVAAWRSIGRAVTELDEIKDAETRRVLMWAAVIQSGRGRYSRALTPIPMALVLPD